MLARQEESEDGPYGNSDDDDDCRKEYHNACKEYKKVRKRQLNKYYTFLLQHVEAEDGTTCQGGDDQHYPNHILLAIIIFSFHVINLITYFLIDSFL